MKQSKIHHEAQRKLICQVKGIHSKHLKPLITDILILLTVGPFIVYDDKR